MKVLSTKQKLKNKILAEYKKLQPKQCVLCGRPATDLCHLLPKSIWPEWYTEPDNLVIMCRECHTQHDDNIEFRTRQDKLFTQACKFDEMGAKTILQKMKVDQIKTVDDMQAFTEGLLNDFEQELSDKEEVLHIFGQYTVRVIEIARNAALEQSAKITDKGFTLLSKKIRALKTKDHAKQ